MKHRIPVAALLASIALVACQDLSSAPSSLTPGASNHSGGSGGGGGGGGGEEEVAAAAAGRRLPRTRSCRRPRRLPAS
jgi:hypothetical protein